MTTPNSGKDIEKLIVYCRWECKMIWLLWNIVWQFLRELNMQLPYDPAAPWSFMLSWEDLSCTQKHIQIEDLFVVAPNWKQPMCPSAREQLSELWYNHTMECYSAIKECKLWIRAAALWISEELCWEKKNSITQRYTV